MAIPSDHYVWLIWGSAFLVPWALLYVFFPLHRRVMLRTSVVTSLFGLTEPLFVPEYWSPPSLFELAQRTGFDIESIIYTFAIGGVGAVLYNVAMRRVVRRVEASERGLQIHRKHIAAFVSPIVLFVPLYFLPWNPIYPGIVALAVGALATIACRRDLVAKTWIGGTIFLGYYIVFLAGLEWTAPGYVARVWNMQALSGIAPFGFPIEEFLFAAAFGTYWSGVYEHLTWTRAIPLSMMKQVRVPIATPSTPAAHITTNG